MGGFAGTQSAALKLVPHTINRAIKLWQQLKEGARRDELPQMCGARDPSNNRPIAVLRGEPGYFLWVESMPPEEWNKANDISPDQVKAMMGGSIFGWPVKRAKADTQRK